MSIIIPAIDISVGKVVRLLKGNFNNKTIYSENILDIVSKMVELKSKRIHIVDLDGSKTGTPQIYNIVKDIRKKYPTLEIEIGGGIRTEHDIKRYKELSCDVILGTAIVDNFLFAKEMSFKYKNIIAGIDCINGIVKTNGWINESSYTIEDLIDKLKETNIRKIIYTNILKDGTLDGINITEYISLKRKYNDFEFIVSGGISCDEDANLSIYNNFNCIIGKAYYEEKVNLLKLNNHSFVNSLKYKEDGLLPAIIQDFETKDVLMLAYMNKESLLITLEEGRTAFFSRSRQAIWRKGETSGHIQEVKELLYDCDEDTLLIKVKQTGNACHTNNKSCFYRNYLKTEDKNLNTSNFGLIITELYTIINNYKTNPKEESYTTYLFESGLDKITKKFGEEAIECVISAITGNKNDIINEISDLLYHLLVLMNEKNVSLEDITICLNNRKK